MRFKKNKPQLAELINPEHLKYQLPLPEHCSNRTPTRKHDRVKS
jgi:hypothetical protein